MKSKFLISALYLIRKTKRCLFFVFVYLFPFFLWAQNYPTRHFTMRDGLPGMAIQSIFKDSQGLMWLGTNSGLCSFDGKSFRIYKPSEGMTASQVWAIAEDEKGNMWFGSYGEGIYKFDGNGFKQFTKKDGLASDQIRVLYWSKNFDCLVAGGNGGVSTIWGDSISSSPPELFNEENGRIVTGLIDAGNFMYVTTYGKNNPLRFYPNENKFVQANNKELFYPVNSFSIYITSKADTVFSYGHFGVAIYKTNGEIVRNESMGQVFGIAEDKRGDLWMASWSTKNRTMIEGVFRYDGKSFKNYKTAFGITDKEIWTVFYDNQQDILWIGTLNEGLFMVPFSGIEQFTPDYFDLEKQQINDLHIDLKDNLWIAGNRELIRLSENGSFSPLGKNSMFNSYRQYWNDKRQKPIPPDFRYLLKPAQLDKKAASVYINNTDFDFYSITQDSENAFLYTNHWGSFLFNVNSNKTTYLGYEGFDAQLAVFGDTLIYAGEGGTFLNPNYLQNRIGLYTNWYFPTEHFKIFSEQTEPKNVTRVVRNEDRSWFSSSQSGLWMTKGMQIVNFNKTDSTISKNLNDLCFDENDHLIFGSNSGEIYFATYSNNALLVDYRLDSNDGLKGNSISWLVADQKGKLWAGTNLGLNCIDLDSLYLKGKTIIRFMDEEEGYTGHMSKKAVSDKRGNLWIGAKSQLIRLNTDKFLSAESSQGKIVLTAIEVNHVPFIYPVNRFSNDFTPENLELKHNENDIFFSFDVLNYINPAKDQFRYKLESDDNKWSEWANTRMAVYTNLHPGNYKLIVESKNLRTLQHAEPLIIDFKIRHPWWGLWFVQAAGLIFLMVIIYIVIRRYTEIEKEKQSKKSKIEKTIVELEMQALQAQMNPHFIFNCINGIQYFVLANKMDEVLAYLSDFSKVVRLSLENATVEMVPLEQEIEFLHSYLRLEQMRFTDKFDYKIQITNEKEAGNVHLPPMLVQPFAENAIRHGFMKSRKKGKLSIVFDNTGKDVLKCTISDNGIGRKKNFRNQPETKENDRLHSGVITEKRIRLFNPADSPEKFKIVITDILYNEKPAGLKVELYLPMEKV